MLFDHMHPVLVVQRHMYGDTWHTAGVAAYRARYSARVLQFQTRVYSGPPCAEHSIVLICEALPWFVLRWSETNGWAFWIAGVPTVCVPEQVCASQPRRSARIPYVRSHRGRRSSRGLPQRLVTLCSARRCTRPDVASLNATVTATVQRTYEKKFFLVPRHARNCEQGLKVVWLPLLTQMVEHTPCHSGTAMADARARCDFP